MANKKYLSLLVTSDIHGYIYPTNYSNQDEQPFGLAKLATLIKEKKKEKAILLLDNGDLIQGSPLTYYHAKYRTDTENPLIKVANHLEYTASVFGNHEFNYGLDYLENVVKQSNFPWLSASILNSEDEPYYGSPYIVKEVEGVSIAILGVTTHYIPNWEDPKHIAGLKFQDALQSTKYWVEKIKSEEAPDIMVVAYHGGFERDLKTGEPTEELTGENQGYEICQQVDGIDVLVTGHQHRSLADVVNGVTVIQPSNNGKLLGEIELEIERINGGWMLIESTPILHSVDNNVKADPEVLNLVSNFEQDTQEWLDKPIGQIDGDMMITDPFKIRTRDNPFIEFINTVQMDVSGVSISNTSLFNNDSPGFSKKVTMRDIVSNYIYPNTLKVIRITGKDIKDALEQSATYFRVNEHGDIEVNPAFVNPKPQHYNYDMWEGIEYELSISNPVGDRVTKLDYQGEPLDYNREYDVVMNNYRAGGGGNYQMYQGKEVIQDIAIDMSELIANYISKRKKIKATCNQNWQVVK